MGKSEKAGADHVAQALKDLDTARRARLRAERHEVAAVARARDLGASWSKIGERYGLTKQGAQQRFKAELQALKDATPQKVSAPARDESSARAS